jgi:hypothetical protein
MEGQKGYVINELYWTHWFEEGVLKIEANIEIFDFSTKKEEKIGFIELSIFDDTWNPCVFYTSVSMSKEVQQAILVDLASDDVSPFNRIAVIDNLFINKKYRKTDLSIVFFKELYFYLSSVLKSDIVLIAVPEDVVNRPLGFKKENELSEIISWFKGFGFKQLGSSQIKLFIDTRYEYPLLEIKKR